jgi:antitoxin component YwqK of YwqJK toxin-antitoxin module
MRWPIVVAMLIAGADAHGARCELDGKPVNLDNGSTTEGRSGIVKCYAADGALEHEQELRDGRFIGLDRRYENGKPASERQVNANGNTDGLLREWYPSGQLKREAHYENGSYVGLARGWFEDGKPASVRYHEKAGGTASVGIEYNAQGQLKDLHCGTRSLVPEDKTLCGFDGKESHPQLYNARGQLRAELVVQAGQVRSMREFRGDGKLASSFEITPEGRLDRRYHPGGEVALEALVVNDFVVRETERYMSGRIKTKTEREPVERNAKATIERYRDSGTLATRTQLIGERRVHEQTFDERGAPSEEFFYDDEGAVARHRAFGPDGAVKTDEELFPDGSQRSSLVPPKE